MRIAAADAPIIPSIDLFWDPKRDEYLVVSHAHNNEMGTNTTAGIEKIFNRDSMETEGFLYVMHDLEGFVGRLPQPPPVDRDAVLREVRRRNKIYKSVSINLITDGDSRRLDIYPMENKRGYLGAMSIESGPLRLSLPTTNDQFVESIKTAFSRIAT